MSLYKITQSRCAQTWVVPSCTEYSAEKGNRKPHWNNNPSPPREKKERKVERKKEACYWEFSSRDFSGWTLSPLRSDSKVKGQGKRLSAMDWSRDGTSIGNGDRWRVQWRTTTRRRWRKSTRVSHATLADAAGHVPRARLNTFTDHFPISFLRLPAHFPRYRARARQYNIYIFSREKEEDKSRPRESMTLPSLLV